MATVHSVKISGAKLMRARENALLSHQELADKAGMHLDHLARIERGEIAHPHMRTIPASRLCAWALSLEDNGRIELGDQQREYDY